MLAAIALISMCAFACPTEVRLCCVHWLNPALWRQHFQFAGEATLYTWKSKYGGMLRRTTPPAKTVGHHS